VRPGNSSLPPPLFPNPGGEYSNPYTHLQGKEVSAIKKAAVSGVKRVNVNVETGLHNAFKAAVAAQGVDMTVVLLQFIESYVAKYGLAPRPKSRRA
jgi:hypothetical protein